MLSVCMPCNQTSENCKHANLSLNYISLKYQGVLQVSILRLRGLPDKKKFENPCIKG